MDKKVPWITIISTLAVGGLVTVLGGGLPAILVALAVGMLGGYGAEQAIDKYRASAPAAPGNAPGPDVKPAAGGAGNDVAGPAQPQTSTLLADVTRTLAHGNEVKPPDPKSLSGAAHPEFTTTTAPTLTAGVAGLGLARLAGAGASWVLNNKTPFLGRLLDLTGRRFSGKFIIPLPYKTPEGIAESGTEAWVKYSKRVNEWNADPNKAARPKPLPTDREANAMRRAMKGKAYRTLSGPERVAFDLAIQEYEAGNPGWLENFAAREAITPTSPVPETVGPPAPTEQAGPPAPTPREPAASPVPQKPAPAAPKPAAEPARFGTLLVKEVLGNEMDGTPVHQVTYEIDIPGEKAHFPVVKVPAGKGLGDNTYRTADPKNVRYFTVDGNGAVTELSDPGKGRFAILDLSGLDLDPEYRIKPVNEAAELTVSRVPPAEGLGDNIYRTANGERYFRVEGEGAKATITEIGQTPEVLRVQAVRALNLTHGAIVLEHLNNTAHSGDQTVREAYARLTSEQVVKIAQSYDAALTVQDGGGTPAGHDFLTNAVRAAASGEPAAAPVPVVPTPTPPEPTPPAPQAPAPADKGQFVPEDRSRSEPVKQKVRPPNENSYLEVEKVPPAEGLGENIYRMTNGPRYFQVEGEGAIVEISATPEVLRVQAVRALNLTHGATVLEHLNNTAHSSDPAVREAYARLTSEQVVKIAQSYDAALTVEISNGTPVGHDFLSNAVKVAASGEPAAAPVPVVPTPVPQEASASATSVKPAGSSASGEPAATPAPVEPVVTPTPVEPAAGAGIPAPSAPAAVQPGAWSRFQQSSLNQRGAGLGMHTFSTFVGGYALWKGISLRQSVKEDDPERDAKLWQANSQIGMGGGMTALGSSGFGTEVALARQFSQAHAILRAGNAVEEAALTRIASLTKVSGGLGAAGGLFGFVMGGARIWSEGSDHSAVHHQVNVGVGTAEMATGAYFTTVGVNTYMTAEAAAAAAAVGTETAASPWLAAAGPIGVVAAAMLIFYDGWVLSAIEEGEQAAKQFAAQGRQALEGRKHPAIKKGYGDLIANKVLTNPRMSDYGHMHEAARMVNELVKATGQTEMYLAEGASPDDIARSFAWAKGLIEAKQAELKTTFGLTEEDIKSIDTRAQSIVDTQAPTGWSYLPLAGFFVQAADDTWWKDWRNQKTNALMAIDSYQVTLATLEGAGKELEGEEKIYIGNVSDNKTFRGFHLQRQIGPETWEKVQVPVDPKHPDPNYMQNIPIVSYRDNYNAVQAYNAERVKAIQQMGAAVKERDIPKMKTAIELVVRADAPPGGLIKKGQPAYKELGDPKIEYPPEVLAEIEAFNKKADEKRAQFDALEKKVLARIEDFEKEQIKLRLLKEYGMDTAPNFNLAETQNNPLFRRELDKLLKSYKGVAESGGHRAAALSYIVDAKFANDPKNMGILAFNADTSLLKELEDFRFSITGDPANPSKKGFRQETKEFEQKLVQKQLELSYKALKDLFETADKQNAQNMDRLLNNYSDITQARVLDSGDSQGYDKLKAWLQAEEKQRVLAKIADGIEKFTAKNPNIIKRLRYESLGLEQRELALLKKLRFDHHDPKLASANNIVDKDFILNLLSETSLQKTIAEHQFLKHLDAKGVVPPREQYAKFLDESKKSEQALKQWASDVSQLGKTAEEREAIDMLIQTRLGLEGMNQMSTLAYGHKLSRITPLNLYKDMVSARDAQSYSMEAVQSGYINILKKLGSETANAVLAANEKLNAAAGHADPRKDTLAMPTTLDKVKVVQAIDEDLLQKLAGLNLSPSQSNGAGMEPAGVPAKPPLAFVTPTSYIGTPPENASPQMDSLLLSLRQQGGGTPAKPADATEAGDLGNLSYDRIPGAKKTDNQQLT